MMVGHAVYVWKNGVFVYNIVLRFAALAETFTHHAQFDPEKPPAPVAQPGRRRRKDPAVLQFGGPLFEEEQNYAQLKAYCPGVANDRNFEDVLKKLTRGAKLAKVGVSKMSAKKNIQRMASAFAAFEEPLRNWIHTFRVAAKRKMGPGAWDGRGSGRGAGQALGDHTTRGC